MPSPIMTSEERYALSHEELEKIRVLDTELTTLIHAKGDYAIGALRSKRPVTDLEVAFLQELTRTEKLIIAMGCGNFSFGYSANFFRHPPTTMAAGHLDKAHCILTLLSDHFALVGEQNNPQARYDRIWKAFGDLFYSEDNRRLLAFYHMDPPRERSYYSY